MNLMHVYRPALAALLLFGLAAPTPGEESTQGWDKVVFHIDESSNARWALMLARSYLDDNPEARLAIVAYGPGVDFLLEGATDRNGAPYDQRVTTLVEHGVDFRVCATTLEAREIARERLLDGVALVPSGISEIARLQLAEGYAYLKP